MFPLLDKLTEEVTQYGTVFGKLWYLSVFVFRMIVVATIGASAYVDEQSAFRCSTKVIGCDNVCYDRFSKISHVRYWSFQLLAVSAPTVLFHFYSSQVRGEIEKIRKAEKEAEQHQEEADSKEQKKLLRRRKSVGNITVKKIYNKNDLVDIALTRRIQIVYYVTVALRASVELASLFLTYNLFYFTDHTIKPTRNPLNAILIRVPQVYKCQGENVDWACGQHMSLGEDGKSGYIPCWVSRPWEKTIFMCYMNILSFFCFTISIVELLQLSGRVCLHKIHKRSKRHSVAQEHHLPEHRPILESSVTSEVFDAGEVYRKNGEANSNKDDSERVINHDDGLPEYNYVAPDNIKLVYEEPKKKRKRRKRAINKDRPYDVRIFSSDAEEEAHNRVVEDTTPK